MVTVLTKFWEKQFGYLLFPLPLVMKFKTVKMRSVATYHKPIYVEWWAGGELQHAQELKKWSLVPGFTPKGKCDEIREYPLETEISYPFD